MVKDLGILWEWEYDEKFVKLLDFFCQRAGKTSYLVSSENLNESLANIETGELRFKVVFDRATDSDLSFMPIVHFHKVRQGRIINEPEKVARATNRAIMHLELVEGGLYVPSTIILSPTDELLDSALEPVGRPFVIKTAEGRGGGEGVFLGAQTICDIQRARELYSEKVFLIQESIVPREFHGMRCWFRVFFVCGKVIPCFWDDRTHIYRRLFPEEEANFGELLRIARKIHDISSLEFFSTEVAQTEDEKYIVVDYVNDQCDMRFQSDTPDGVPNSVVEEIAKTIVDTL